MTDSNGESSEEGARHAEEIRPDQPTRADTVCEQLHTADGPGGVREHPGIPGPTPDQPGGSVIMHHPCDPWTEEVRRAAFRAVQIAAVRREAGDRTFRYFLRQALAHGLSLDDVCRAANLSPQAVLKLTDPAVA